MSYSPQDLQRVLGGEPGLVPLDPDVGVEIGEPLLGRVELGPAQSGGAVHDLPLKIGQVDDIEVHDPDRADSGRGQVERQRTTRARRRRPSAPGRP